MRYAMLSAAPARRAAKTLKDHLRIRDVPCTLSACREAVARMHGYNGWRDLLANVGKLPPSPDDADLPADQLVERRKHQAEALAECFPRVADHAWHLVEMVAPTRATAPTGTS